MTGPPGEVSGLPSVGGAPAGDVDPVAGDPADPDSAPRPLCRGLVRGSAASGLAVAAGVLLFLGFPPRGWWWLAPVALALFGAAVRGHGARAGAGLGLLSGLAFFVPLLSWTGEFVGPLPWLALAALQAVFISLAGAAIGVLPLRWWWPLGAAALWIALEAVRARVPFDGFPWGRIGFGQPEGLFAPVAALGGVPGLGFVVALFGFAVLEMVATARRIRGPAPGPILLALAPTAVAVAAPLLTAPPPEPRTALVAVVQGNVPRAGLDFNAQRRAVLDNHVRQTEALAGEVAAGRTERPDLVLWPENSADIDPLRNPDARAGVDRAVRAVGAPVLVGAVLTPPAGAPTNTMISWTPLGGPGETHDKRRLQPFGEYVPLRDFFRLFSPLVDRSSNFLPGSGDGAVTLAGIVVGVATCYEVIFDDLVRDSVRAGAELLAVPSNNATFGWTDMTFQQLAIDRVRAIEFRRTTVVPTTSGVSAIVLPDGQLASTTERFRPATLVEHVPLSTAITPAARYGGELEAALVGGALGALVVTTGVRSRERVARSGRVPTPGP